MGKLIIPSAIPDCPLCLNQMKIIYVQTLVPGPGFQGFRYEKRFACERPDCKISINVKDPAVDKWDAKEPPKCTICGHDMRVFFRTFDKYFKCQCPYCMSKGKKVEVVREVVPEKLVGPND